MKSQSMKPFVILMALVCAFSQWIEATPITRQQAQQNAIAFMQQRGRNIAMSSLRQLPMLSVALQPIEAFYVFNIGDNQGYVIASGDDCTPAILGYAYSGSVDDNDMPENMRWWLEEYATQIQLMRDHGLSGTRARVRLSSLPAVPPMLTTGWDQVAPYNRFTPLNHSGNHYVTGCVATAMAQVLYYHRSKSVSQTTHEMPAYITEGGLYVDAIPAGSFIDWDNMLDSYWNVSATEEQMDAVAWLMRYCGSAVHMQYATGSSSAHTECVAPAMIAYFNYDSRVEAIRRNDSGLSDEAWEQLVYDELSNSRPVLYSGVKANSLTGHAFVCDGYDGEGYFHINWGWGKTQGYYLLTAIDEEGTSLINYNRSQAGIFFAEPRQDLPSAEGEISFADPIARAICLHYCDTDNDGALTMEEALATTEMGPFSNVCFSSFDEFKYFTGVTAISNMMFAGCESLESITLHDHITSIGKSAFASCRSLKEFTMPPSVTVLKAQAFMGCNSLKHFIWNARNCGLEFMATLPNSVEWLEFGDSVNVVPNTVAKSANITKLTLGKSISRIGSSAFYQCSGLKSVVIPNSVSTISARAFGECTGLNDLTLGNSVTYIGDRAFEQCSNLKWITIPNSVTYIGSYAFRGCANVKSVVIGKSVTDLKILAFAGCDNLETVTCLMPAPPAINENVFKDLYARVTLRVPAASLEDYKETSPWNQFADIIPIDPTDGDVNLDGVTNIDDITELINCILNNTAADYGDVDGDGAVNIDDITALINKVLTH